MDSYNLHFERMSNVDLQTLSLPVNRLSPAKSNSSIIDQLAHHQHGKGDSAYSSFSGGSTAPDYPSPFLSDDLQSSSFSPFADLKYVKSIYHPIQSDTKTMDQLYRSVEAFSVHYCNNPSTAANQHNSNNRFHNNSPEVFSGGPNQSSHLPEFAPPVPARIDSYIATKNLENNTVPQHSAEDKHHQLQSQQQPRSYPRIHTQQLGSKQAQSPDKSNSETVDSNFHFDPVFSVWKDPQEQQPQIQPPPGFLPQLKLNNETRVTETSDCLIMDNKPECIKLRRLSASSGCNGDHSRSSSSTTLESQRQRSHSEYDLLGSDSSHAASLWNAGQSFINSSIQHKGQFYFVTGLCKLPDSNMRTNAASVCGSDTGSECSSSTVVEKHWIREKERSHSTMDNLFRPLHENCHTFGGTIQDKNETFMSLSNFKDLSSKSLDQENHKPSFVSTRSSRSFDALEEMDMIQSREISRHIANNPIFYCGPDKNDFSHSATETKEVSTLLTNEQPPYPQREEKAKKGKRQPLSEVASERINKETTPLLYHLTEGNKAALQPRKDTDVSIKINKSTLNNSDQESTLVNDDERALRIDLKKNHGGDMISGAYNTLDESFKKYYKEKLKDAQSKVLRETSFKRRDLQLSWPHRIRQKSEFRPAIIHSFTPSQDSQTSTETLTPSMTSEDTDQCSIKEEVEETHMEVTTETEKENGRPENVAQPQVARVGGRKRLTPEQKKMCYSEPEKLNQLGGNPSHSACRSFGNERENPFAADCEREASEQPGERGLVATRRKLFEMRDRANSASSTSKTNLKHLQHKALVEYMERKTGQKGAEPQQPAPQVPPPPRQRHSMGEKPFDWGPTVSGINESKHTKKKLHRPLSAGRILDSSTSSIRYAQFTSTQSVSGQYSDQSNQPKWKESQGRHQGKSASADSLLEQPGPSDIYRIRSTSTPHVLETRTCDREPVNGVETCSPQMGSLVKPDPESYQPVRVVAQRGKSMEELGTLKLARPSALSRSSEQLDRLWRHSPGFGGPDMDKNSFSLVTEVRERNWLEKEKNKQIPAETVINEFEKFQGPVQSQTGHTTKVLWKQNSAEPGEDVSVVTRKSSRPTTPSSCSFTQARVQSVSHDPVPEEFRSCRPPSETSSNPPSPRGLDTSEKEIKSTSTSPVQTKPPCESRASFGRVRTSSVIGSEMEQSVDEPIRDCQPAESNEEVSLSCGVTTDPALWILSLEEDVEKEVRNALPTDSLSEDRLTCSTLQGQASETSLSPCISASAPDQDKTQEEEEEKNQESEKVKLDRNQLKERCSPEAVLENLKASCEKPQWDELVEAVVQVDQSLTRVFYPLTNRKTALMLMEQLLSEDTLLMEEHYKKKQEQGGAAESVDTVKGSDTSLCPPTADGSKSQCADLESQTDIPEKKHLLVSCIEEQLRSLEKMRDPLQNEIQENATRGQALELLVREHCQPLELERYSLFIGDLERVVSLLLCLSARLARVQNALSTVDQHTDIEEKESLDNRYRLLCKQREDAKDLKDNLDRRENLVSTFLSRQLSPEQLQDYRRFVQTMASLLIRQKDLEEKLRLGEEQLEALINSHSL